MKRHHPGPIHLIKRLLLILTGALLLVAIASVLTYQLVSDQVLARWITGPIEKSQDLRIRASSLTISRGLSPELIANKLLIEDRSGRFELRVDNLAMRVRLAGLLRGVLELDQVRIGLTRINRFERSERVTVTSGHAASSEIDFPLTPIIHQLVVEGVVIRGPGDPVRVPSLNVGEFKLLTNPDRRTVSVFFSPNVAGTRINATLTIPRLLEIVNQKRAPFTLALVGLGGSMKLDGILAEAAGTTRMDAGFNGRISSLTGLTTAAELPPIPGEISISGEVSGPMDRLRLSDLLVEWSEPAGARAKASGQIADLANLKGVEINVQASADNPPWLAQQLSPAIRDLKHAAFSARLNGDEDQLKFSDLSLSIHTTEDLELTATGGMVLDHLTTRPRLRDDGLELELLSPSLRSTMPGVSDLLAELGPVAGTARLRIEDGLASLKAIDVRLTKGETVKARLSGEYGQYLRRDGDAALAVDLMLDVESADTESVNKLLALSIPEFGPLHARGRLVPNGDRFSLIDILIETTDGGDTRFSAAGSADSLVFGGRPMVSGITLEARLQAENFEDLGKRFNVTVNPWIPGPLDASTRISGDDQALRVSHGTLTWGDPDGLLLQVSGHAGLLTADDSWRPRKTSLDISLAASGSDSLSHAAGVKIPDWGPFSARGYLSEKDGLFGLSSIFWTIGTSEFPAIEGKGSIADLPRMAGTELELDISLSGRQLAALADNEAIPDLGSLTGHMHLSDADGTLGMEVLHLETDESDLFSVQADGSFDDFSEPDSIEMDLLLKARDMHLLGAIWDQDWPAVGPVMVAGRAHRDRMIKQLVGRIDVGRSRVRIDLNGSSQSERPFLNGQMIFDPMAFADWNPIGEANARDSKIASSGKLFSDRPLELGWLNKLDSNMEFRIESIVSDLQGLQSGHAELELQSGHLRIESASLDFQKGNLTFGLDLDARDVPKLVMDLEGQDLDPWASLHLNRETEQLESLVNVSTSIATQGTSPRDLAANADGWFRIETSNGRIQTRLLSLFFVDLVGWASDQTFGKKYEDLDCAMADFQVENGVVSIKEFFLESESFGATGRGTVNLVNEQVDAVFLPRRKSTLLKNSTPVKIKGPLNDPKVFTVPWKSAATAFGQVALTPLFLGLSLTEKLTKSLRRNRPTPCDEHAARVAADAESGDSQRP